MGRTYGACKRIRASRQLLKHRDDDRGVVRGQGRVQGLAMLELPEETVVRPQLSAPLRRDDGVAGSCLFRCTPDKVAVVGGVQPRLSPPRALLFRGCKRTSSQSLARILLRGRQESHSTGNDSSCNNASRNN